MDIPELQTLLLRNTADIQDMRQQLAAIQKRDSRAEHMFQDLRHRLADYLASFDRDGYKQTDRRLAIIALANELLIFDRLGFDLESLSSEFLLGVAALLEGRNRDALAHLSAFLRSKDSSDRNFANACYLAGMIAYNRREYQSASEFFASAFSLSSETNRDWQSRIYCGELTSFMRKPAQEVERIFRNVEEGVRKVAEPSRRGFLLASLYLKLGNCYVGTFLAPRQPNPMVNNPIAIECYKQARSALPAHVPPDSLLPVVIDYSLAQALLLANSVDMSLAQTPSELLADTFHRMRRVVLTKREEIILAQCYLMLATCVFYSSHLTKDLGEIYLEYARHQTLVVPSDVCFFSGVTKELLNRDEFVAQIDYFARELDRQTIRR